MNLSAFESKSFRHYLAFMSIALHGMWIQRLVIAWLAWHSSNSPAFVGFVAFLSFAPTMITGPVFGVLADRVEIRLAVFTNYVVMLFITLSFIAAAYFYDINELSVALFSTAIGLVASANHPFRMALAARLGNKKQLSSIIAITTLNFNLSRLIGPAIGGILVSKFGPIQTLWVTSVGFLPIIFLIQKIPIRERDSDTKEEQHFLEALKEGFLFTKKEPFLLYIFGLTICVTMLGRGLLETLPIVAQGVFQAGPSELGLLTASAGGGAIAASFVKALGKPQKKGKIGSLGAICSILVPFSIIIIGVSDNLLFTAALVSLLGFVVTFFSTTMISAAQLQLTDEFRGRVMSLWTMTAMGGGAIGAIILGVISEIFGISSTFISLGGLISSIVAFILFFPRPKKKC